MAKCTVKLVRCPKGTPKKTFAALKPGAAVADFIIQDNGDDTCTVFATDAAGNQAALPTTASLAVTSSDTTKITVDTIVGATFAMHAVGPLTVPGTPVSITVVATWSDGSVGPFTFVLPCDVQAGPTTGVVIVPGPPTTH